MTAISVSLPLAGFPVRSARPAISRRVRIAFTAATLGLGLGAAAVIGVAKTNAAHPNPCAAVTTSLGGLPAVNADGSFTTPHGSCTVPHMANAAAASTSTAEVLLVAGTVAHPAR
jgi:hypothetical protein